MILLVVDFITRFYYSILLLDFITQYSMLVVHVITQHRILFSGLLVVDVITQYSILFSGLCYVFRNFTLFCSGGSQGGARSVERKNM